MQQATHIFCDKIPKERLPPTALVVHSDWLLYKILPPVEGKTEEDFHPSVKFKIQS